MTFKLAISSEKLAIEENKKTENFLQIFKKSKI